VSHFPERTEKNCLNCGNQVLGRYCQECGQENLEPKETVLHLVSHFINDITHFDGKFFSTLKYLLFRPGFLSAEYVRGRRMSYLHPIRMYVFTSAIFFLVFYSLAENATVNANDPGKVYTKMSEKRDKLVKELASTKAPEDKKDLQEQIAADDSVIAALKKAKLVPGGSKTEPAYFIPDDSADDGHTKVTFASHGLGGEVLPSTLWAYDSIQQQLSPAKRQPWLYRMVNRRVVDLTQRYHSDKKEFKREIREHLLHTFPKILFVSLPLFALLLRLLNLRRRKQILYVDHGIFTIHLFCATFIMMLVEMLLNQVNEYIPGSLMSWIETILFFAVFFYEYKAMRNFYKQGRGKTIFKFFILNTVATILIGFVTIFFVLWTIIAI